MTEERLKSRLEICIHVRTLRSAVETTRDTQAINQALKKWIRRSQELYLQHDVEVKPVSYATLDLPALKVLDAGAAGPSTEQTQLVDAFRQQEAPAENHLVAFLVDAIVDPNGLPVVGCAVHELNALMLSAQTDDWTFGHEIGHLLIGAGHTNDAHRLMYDDTAKIVAKPFPLLVWRELVSIRSSPFAQPSV